MNTLATLLSIVIIGANFVNLKTTPPPTIEDYAEQCGMTESEFILISSVTEAESDRSDSMSGRVLIALTILNRVDSDIFPDTITEVLTQSGQFSTVVRRNGIYQSVTNRTELSDQAVLEAYEWNQRGDDPNVLFFNCRGYNYGTPYDYVDGNYFMIYGE